MGKTTIEWCDHTVNPIRAKRKRGAAGRSGHYCEKISPGCANCYASALQWRFGMPTFDVARRSKLDVFLDVATLEQVEKRKKPTAYFWEDMSDLFGEWVKTPWLDRCFATMLATPQHQHLILTKRIDRAQKYLTDRGKVMRPFPPKHIFVGASMENQKYADERMPTLLALQADGWSTFVSAEPLIGAMTLKWAACTCGDKRVAFGVEGHTTTCYIARHVKPDVVIIGGESGRGARPLYLQWVRSLIRQCGEAGIRTYVKQLGSFPTRTPVGTRTADQQELIPEKVKLRAYKGGDITEWDAEFRVRDPLPWKMHVWPDRPLARKTGQT